MKFQSILYPEGGTSRKPGHHLAREALLMANKAQKRRGKTKCELTLRWTTGHEGIEGKRPPTLKPKRRPRACHRINSPSLRTLEKPCLRTQQLSDNITTPC